MTAEEKVWIKENIYLDGNASAEDFNIMLKGADIALSHIHELPQVKELLSKAYNQAIRDAAESAELEFCIPENVWSVDKQSILKLLKQE